jgi:hypothetical protein
MSWIAAIILCKTTGISEVEFSSDRAKGLRLQQLRGSWSRSSRTIIFTKKKEWREIETVYRKLERDFKPKVRIISFRMGFFEQSPCFATDNHIPTMNPCWQHILRKPNLQNLRSLKFTRQIVQTQYHNPTNLHIYTNCIKEQVFQQS